MPKKAPDKKLPAMTEEDERLRKWRSEFQQDLECHLIWVAKKRNWEEFYDGNQLTQQEKEALKKRNQPEVVINQIQPFIDGSIGDFLGRRVMMRARDKGSLDFDVAKHVTEAIRYVEDRNRFDEIETTVAEQLFIGGRGWYKVSLEFDFMEPEIKIDSRKNDDIVIDRRSRKVDISDAKRMYETVWVEVEDLVELYPEHEEDIRKSATLEKETFNFQGPVRNKIGDQYAHAEAVTAESGFDFETFIDPERQRLRLINVWEREKVRVEFAFHPDIKGTVQEITDFTEKEKAQMEKNFPGVQKFAQTKWKLNAGVMIATKILEYKEDVRPHDSQGKFPYVQAVAKVEHGENPQPYGLVKQYIDAQKEYNKRRSKLLHKSNTNRILAEEGAFPKNDTERIRQEASKPDGVVMFKPGKRFEIDKDDPNQTDVFMLQLARSEIQGVGVTKEFAGQEDKVLSGRAIALRQTEGQKMIRKYFAALRSARRDVFTIVLEEMQQYWTSEKLIKITDDQEAGNVILNQRVANVETGRPEIINNLRLGKYDIKIDEDLETPNQRQETFQNLVQLGQVALQAGEAFPIEMVIKSSDLANKKEWLDAIAKRREQQAKMAEMQMKFAQLQALAKAGAGQNGQTMSPM